MPFGLSDSARRRHRSPHRPAPRSSQQLEPQQLSTLRSSSHSSSARPRVRCRRRYRAPRQQLDHGGTIIATEKHPHSAEVEDEACQPADVTVTVTHAQALASKDNKGAKESVPMEDMANRVLPEERMRLQKQNIKQAQAMNQMYEKARNEAAGPTSAPHPTPSRSRRQRSSSSSSYVGLAAGSRAALAGSSPQEPDSQPATSSARRPRSAGSPMRRCTQARTQRETHSARQASLCDRFRASRRRPLVRHQQVNRQPHLPLDGFCPGCGHLLQLGQDETHAPHGRSLGPRAADL